MSDYLTSSSPGLATAGYQGTITITPFSTLNRPNSRSSLASSRLSSSHNSINTTGLSNKADDSSFITSAMSHDILTTSQISDMYNVPFDSDIYTVPIDVVRPLHHELRTPQRPKRHKHHRKRRRNVSASSQSEFEFHIQQQSARHYCGGVLGKPRSIGHCVVKSQKMLAEVCCNDSGAAAVSTGATANGACGNYLCSMRNKVIIVCVYKIRTLRANSNEMVLHGFVNIYSNLCKINAINCWNTF